MESHYRHWPFDIFIDIAKLNQMENCTHLKGIGITDGIEI